MEPSSRLWNRINEFLEKHTFDLEWTPPGVDKSVKINTNFKIQLTGKNIYRQVNEKEYIEYKLYILPSGGYSDSLFSAVKEVSGHKSSDPYSGVYYLVNSEAEDMLSNFLMHFGIDYPLICTEVVNLVD